MQSTIPRPWFLLLLCTLLLLLLLLTGCATRTQVSQDPPTAKPDETQSRSYPPKVRKELKQVLREAETPGSPQRDLYLLQAAELLRLQNAWEETGRLLEQVRSDSLSEPLVSRFNLLRLEWLLQSSTPRDALMFMSDRIINEEHLGEGGGARLASLRADVYAANRHHLAAARERVPIHDSLEETERLRNTELLWSSLMELPMPTLEQQAIQATTYDFRGWLILASLARKQQGNLALQWQQFREWQLIWEDHPASAEPPASLATLPASLQGRPETVALLLPFSGPLAPYGEAIRDGFMAAHFSLGGSVKELRLYDSETDDISGLLKEVIDEGADFIIGPLDRQRVARVAASNRRKVPVLALNQVDQTDEPLFFQLGLTPADEVRQLVSLAAEQGHRRAALIYPAGPWGERHADLFRTFSESQGIQIAVSGPFSESEDYRPYVSQLLNVANSLARAEQLKSTIGASFEFTPRRRQDLDFVALFATPDQARGINPALAYLYAEDVPTYSVSQINSGKLTEIEYLDLDGVYFCDLPFKLLREYPLRKQINPIWPESEGQLAAFYALGIDAYHLFPRVMQMAGRPGYRLHGATGTLSVGDNGRVSRRLVWAQVRSGNLQLNPTFTDQQISKGKQPSGAGWVSD